MRRKQENHLTTNSFELWHLAVQTLMWVFICPDHLKYVASVKLGKSDPCFLTLILLPFLVNPSPSHFQKYGVICQTITFPLQI